jgi:hypothetical protein
MFRLATLSVFVHEVSLARKVISVNNPSVIIMKDL